MATTADFCGVRGPFLRCELIKTVARPNEYPITVEKCRVQLEQAMDKCKKVCVEVVRTDEHPMATFNYCTKWVKREDLSLKHFKWDVTDENEKT